MQYFERRDLRAYSVEPLLLFPTHYTGEPGYVSDTETSTIWDDESVMTDWDRAGAKEKLAQEGEGADVRALTPGFAHSEVPPVISTSGSRDDV